MDHPVATPKRSSAAGGWGALKSCGKHLLGSWRQFMEVVTLIPVNTYTFM